MWVSSSVFLSTLSLRRATGEPARPVQRSNISIHALLAESDSHTFNLTRFQCYFYPRSPCGERLASSVVLSNTIKISIHALLAESDRRTFRNQQRCSNFYPRSPCGERRGLQPKAPTGPKISIHALLAESDRHYYYICNNRRAFLSTLSLRRATVALCGYERAAGFLSTLSLRRATMSTGSRGTGP